MDCHHPTIRYTEFSKAIHESIERTNIPISGAIEITAACNMRCTHCYMPRILSDTQLTTDELIHIIDEIADAGCLWLLITGGEPLLRPDFFDIYDHAKRRGILMTIFTNGTLITERIADKFAQQPPFSIEISIYGATEETYERITRVPGSYKRCMEGIRMLKERNLPLKLKTMGLKSNVHEIATMKAFADSLGLPFRFDPLINPTIEGSDEPLSERLDPQAVVDLESTDEERSREWRALYKQYYGYTKSDYVYTCGAGKNYFHIDAYGKLNMCVLLRIPGYDLRTGSFQEGYSQFQSIRETKKCVPDRCSTCKINIMCGLCPGWALLEQKDASCSVPYLCSVAHLRAKRFS